MAPQSADPREALRPLVGEPGFELRVVLEALERLDVSTAPDMSSVGLLPGRGLAFGSVS